MSAPGRRRSLRGRRRAPAGPVDRARPRGRSARRLRPAAPRAGRARARHAAGQLAGLGHRGPRRRRGRHRARAAARVLHARADRPCAAAAGATRCSAAPGAARLAAGAATALRRGGPGAPMVRLPATPVAAARGTSKITFTSGTTGAPKGVCLARRPCRRSRDGLVRGAGPLRHRAPPVRAAARGAAGEHRRPVAPLLARRDLRGAAAGAAGPAAARRASTRRASMPPCCAMRPAQPHPAAADAARVGRLPAGRARQRAPARCGSSPSAAPRSAPGLVCGARAVSASRPTRATACPKALRCRRSTCPAPTARAAPAARCRMRACASRADGEIEVARQPVCRLPGRASAPPQWWPTGDLGDDRRRRLPARAGPQEARADHGLRPQRLARVGRDGAAQRERHRAGRGVRRRRSPR